MTADLHVHTMRLSPVIKQTKFTTEFGWLHTKLREWKSRTKHYLKHSAVPLTCKDQFLVYDNLLISPATGHWKVSWAWKAHVLLSIMLTCQAGSSTFSDLSRQKSLGFLLVRFGCHGTMLLGGGSPHSHIVCSTCTGHLHQMWGFINLDLTQKPTPNIPSQELNNHTHKYTGISFSQTSI